MRNDDWRDPQKLDQTKATPRRLGWTLIIGGVALFVVYRFLPLLHGIGDIGVGAAVVGLILVLGARWSRQGR